MDAVERAVRVRRVRLHHGRHPAAMLLLASGVNPRVVMELLGHSAMSTTTDIYSHVMPALAQQADVATRSPSRSAARGEDA